MNLEEFDKKLQKERPKAWEEYKRLEPRFTIISENLIKRAKIKKAILLARKSKNITQTELQEKSGVKQPLIARIETGKTDPQITTFLKILKPLGYTLALVEENKKKEIFRF
jgi:predicted transcriptional regulator